MFSLSEKLGQLDSSSIVFQQILYSFAYPIDCMICLNAEVTDVVMLFVMLFNLQHCQKEQSLYSCHPRLRRYLNVAVMKT